MRADFGGAKLEAVVRGSFVDFIGGCTTGEAEVFDGKTNEVGGFRTFEDGEVFAFKELVGVVGDIDFFLLQFSFEGFFGFATDFNVVLLEFAFGE